MVGSYHEARFGIGARPLTPVLATRSQPDSANMSLGNRRHIPFAIEELMVTLQARKGLRQKEVAGLLDVDVRTVRRVTKLEAETGSVVQVPFAKGP